MSRPSEVVRLRPAAACSSPYFAPHLYASSGLHTVLDCVHRGRNCRPRTGRLGMTNSSESLPFFVYGTLRRGWTNYSLFGDAIVSERVGFLESATMTVSFVPFVHIDPGGSGVVGEVISVVSKKHPQVMMWLDGLEGYRGRGRENLYERETVNIRLASGDYIECWTYLVPPDRAAAQVIESGDYSDFRRTH